VSGERWQTDARAANIGELREHAQLFASHVPGPLRLLRMRAGDVSIEVEWHDPAEGGHGSVSHTATPAGEAGQGAAGLGDDQQLFVTAPVVGTFYRAPAPDADPFVEIGDLVELGQTVGIVEAMKLMNAVTAECAGYVTHVLAGNAQPVEFGQPLIALTAVAPADADPMTTRS
jgi:acetyl-CoA carboxylase biotin carboxyl carrier protein